MKTIIKRSLLGLMLVPLVALAVSTVMPLESYAQVESIKEGIGATGLDDNTDLTAKDLIGRVIYWFLVIVGALAVIMLIYGGFKYITSGGDASKVTSAKNTILYAVIGLIVVLLSGAIVNFVLNSLIDGTAG